VVGDTGFVFALENPLELRDFLLAVDRGVLRAMGERGRARFLQRYTTARMVAETEAVYRLALDA
jgi:hypothetical protein